MSGFSGISPFSSALASGVSMSLSSAALSFTGFYSSPIFSSSILMGESRLWPPSGDLIGLSSKTSLLGLGLMDLPGEAFSRALIRSRLYFGIELISICFMVFEILAWIFKSLYSFSWMICSLGSSFSLTSMACCVLRFRFSSLAFFFSSS